MNRLALLIFIAGALGLGTSLAQHQPYAGLQTRAVKALSDEQIADLKAGRGMGLALAAELNGYPGPRHVIELADKLELSAAQRAKAQDLYAAMKAETIPFGERLIAQEQHLEGLFANKTITPASLEAATAAIGNTQGALRAAHLRYHLRMFAELMPEQVDRYSRLRGYMGESGTGHTRGHHRAH